MTNEQIEDLKREALDELHQQIRDELSPSGMILATIDFLASQNRLLADGCVGCPIIPTEEMIGAPLYSNTDMMTSEEYREYLSDTYQTMISAQTEKQEG